MKIINYFILIAFCGLLIYVSLDLPNRADLDAVINRETSPAGTPNAAVFYTRHSYEDAHTPNIVTVILADYRGYDTMGETTVIFTAGLICMMLLRKRRKP